MPTSTTNWRQSLSTRHEPEERISLIALGMLRADHLMSQLLPTWKSSSERQASMSRHPNSQRFHDILAELGELHDRKQADYGRGDDPFANVRASEEIGRASCRERV